jgi:hypothetical protein
MHSSYFHRRKRVVKEPGGGGGAACGEICGPQEGVSVHLLMGCLACHCMSDRNYHLRICINKMSVTTAPK